MRKVKPRQEKTGSGQGQDSTLLISRPVLILPSYKLGKAQLKASYFNEICKIDSFTEL